MHRPSFDAASVGNALAAVLIAGSSRRTSRSPAAGEALQSVDVARSTSAETSGQLRSTVIFPVTALFGLISVLPDGPEVEVATIGWEGVLGFPAASGEISSGTRVLCHIPGRTLQMPAEALQERLDEDARTRAVFDHYVALSIMLLSQRAACGQRHGAAHRYATWPPRSVCSGPRSPPSPPGWKRRDSSATATGRCESWIRPACGQPPARATCAPAVI
jgi:hypothetical protein